jgi:hypothetical protein
VAAEGCEGFPYEALLAQFGEDAFSSSMSGPIWSGETRWPVAKKYMMVVLSEYVGLGVADSGSLRSRTCPE